MLQNDWIQGAHKGNVCSVQSLAPGLRFSNRLSLPSICRSVAIFPNVSQHPKWCDLGEGGSHAGLHIWEETLAIGCSYNVPPKGPVSAWDASRAAPPLWDPAWTISQLERGCTAVWGLVPTKASCLSVLFRLAALGGIWAECKSPGRARTVDGGSVLEWDLQEIFLVLAVYGKKEAGRDLGGLCKDCGWQREGTERECASICLEPVSWPYRYRFEKQD